MDHPSAPDLTPAILALEPMPAPLDGPAPPDAEEAPSARRNAGPLLAVLRGILPSAGTVLEGGAGTGQHAAAFAAALAPLRWLPTDPQASRIASVPLWANALRPQAARPLPARVLDAAAVDWPLKPEDDIRAIVATNVIHIAPWSVAKGILAGAARWLAPGDPLVFYGPFRRDGAHTSDGNTSFDASLRVQDPSWGIRDLESELVPTAQAAGLDLDRVQAMPANNFTVVLRRR